MTNADKFLRDGVKNYKFIDEFIDEIITLYRNWNYKKNEYLSFRFYIEEWLNKQIKSTLTEDERVILRNIKKDYTIVARDKAGDLFIATDCDENGVRGHNALEFNRCLFQFIKNGEEYSIEELLEEGE